VAKFYHFTSNINIPLIEQDGLLKPGVQTGKRNTYMGVQGDPNFIYLWYPGVIKIIGFLMMLGIAPNLTLKNNTLLEVEVDESTVERDYDQLLYVFEENYEDEEQLRKRLALQADSYGLKLDDFTPPSVIKAIDSISGEQWNKKPGSYRLSQSIDNFRIVPWREVIPWYVRALAPFCSALRILYIAAEKFIAKRAYKKNK